MLHPVFRLAVLALILGNLFASAAHSPYAAAEATFFLAGDDAKITGGGAG